MQCVASCLFRWYSILFESIDTSKPCVVYIRDIYTSSYAYSQLVYYHFEKVEQGQLYLLFCSMHQAMSIC